MSEISENKPEIEIIENNNSEKTETQTKIEESTVDELADSNPKNIDDENSSETSPLPQGVLEKETEKNDNQDDEVQEEDTLEAENDITLEDENVVTEEKNEIEIMENDVVLKTPGKSDGNQGLDENEEKNKKSPSSSASSVVSLSTSNPEKSRNTPIPSSACMDNPVPKTLSKHRLQDTWTLWFMDGDKNKRNDKPKDWRENLTPLYTFNTVEDFWILYSHILNPSKLRVKNDYMLFKEGIKPEWEDPGNKAGGKWQLVLPNKFRQDLLDKCWLKTILGGGFGVIF